MKAKVSTVNISLPAPMRERLEQKVTARGTYGSTSEYVRELIRRDLQRDDAIEQIDQLLYEGVRSGFEPMTAAWRKERRAELVKPKRAHSGKAKRL